MSVFFNYINAYWKYYIALEKQFMETSRYVEFDYVNNGKAYSMEYMKLFQAVCSEIDIVGKELARYAPYLISQIIKRESMNGGFRLFRSTQ